MINFAHCHDKIQVFDHYYTPYYVWGQINHLFPKNKVIWEAFMLNSKLSKSKENLITLGNNTIGDTTYDFFEMYNKLEYDIIVSNIPYGLDLKKQILKTLVEIDKPFIIVMNSANIHTNYFNNTFKHVRKHLQIIFPRGKLFFEKVISDSKTELLKKTSFCSVYVAYKMNIPNENLYLD